MERMIRVVRPNGDEVARYRIELFHYRALDALDFAVEAAERVRDDKLVREDELADLDFEVMSTYDIA